MLEVGHHVGAPHMGFAADAESVFAADFERVAQDRRIGEGQAVTLDRLARDLLKSHALDPAIGAGEIFGDEIGFQAHGVENLRTAIGLIGGDAHLGHHLEDALAEGLDIAVRRLLKGQLPVEFRQHRVNRVEGQVRVDRLGAVAGQGAELMHLMGLAGLDHEADGGAQALADQVMMHGAGGEQRRDRNPVGAGRPVGQDDDVLARAHRRLGVLAKLVEGGAHAGGAMVGCVGDVEGDSAKVIVGDVANAADALQVLVGEDRVRGFEPLLLGGAFEVEQIRPRANKGHERHDELLADRIDRRVRHLREGLLEIGVQELRPVGEGRKRRVGAHGADGLLADLSHGRHQEFEALLGVAKGLLAIEQAHIGARCGRLGPGQLVHANLRAVEPLLIGIGARKLGFDLLVGDDALLLKIDEQHLAGLEPPLPHDLLFGDFEHASLRGHDHKAVVRDEIARGPEAVAVKRGADIPSVGEGHGGRTVPGLHQAGVIFVEGAALGIHQRIAGPSLRDQHHGGVGQAVAASHQELERIVKARRVGLPLIGDRPELGDVLAE